MKIKILHSDEVKQTRWSGGTTMELFLYPENGDYGTGDFRVRVSTAVIEKEVSVFTPLPGVRRQLMTLQGNLQIKHGDSPEKELLPNEVDCFSGEEETHAVGKVRDFNLMLKGNASGEMLSLILNENESCQWQDGGAAKTVVFYAAQGSGMLAGNAISGGDTICVNEYSRETLSIEAHGEGLQLAVCSLEVL